MCQSTCHLASTPLATRPDGDSTYEHLKRYTVPLCLSVEGPRMVREMLQLRQGLSPFKNKKVRARCDDKEYAGHSYVQRQIPHLDRPLVIPVLLV